MSGDIGLSASSMTWGSHSKIKHKIERKREKEANHTIG